MKPNTAICFVLMGAALTLMGRFPITAARRILGCTCVAVALAITAAVLGESTFHWHSRVDEWLFKDPMDTVRTAAPGRMALPSIAAFFLTGLALLTLDWKLRRFFRPAEWLALLAFYLGVLSTLAHLLTTEAFDGYLGFTPMALHTSLGFMLLCGGILTARKGGLANYLRDAEINPTARRIYLALAGSAVLLVTAGFATLLSAYDSAARQEQVHHTYHVRQALLSVLSTLQDLETGARGYLLTGDPVFLMPHNEALDTVDAKLNELESLVANDPVQIAHMPRLRQLIGDKIEYARDTVAARSTEDLAAVADRISTRNGKILMDSIRNLVGEMDSEESLLLALRKREELQSAGRLSNAIGVGGLLSMVILLFSAMAIHRGIRHEQHSREALRNSEANLATTLRSIGDGVMTTDTQNRVTGLNPVAEALTGWSEDEAKGKLVSEVFQIIKEGSREPAEIPVCKVLATGRIQGLANHTVLVARDGTEHPISDSAAPLYDVKRVLRGVVLVFRDVTVERAAEIERDRIFLLSRDLLCIAHEDGYFKRVNPAFTDQLGWTSEEILSRPFLDFIHPDDHATVERTLEKHLVREVQVMETENRFRHKNGTWHVISWKSVPQPDGFIFATGREVTALKAAEAALKRAMSEADTANRAKSSFLATMSHEIRTPMNGVIGTVDVLRQTSLHPYQKELVEIIRESAYALLAVIDGILDYSKIEAGKMELECAPMSLPQLLETVCDTLNPFAVRKQVDLTYFTDPRLPAMIDSDSVRVRQILNNLVGNAVKFSAGQKHAGRVRVRIVPDGDERVRITVADNGVGIAPELLGKLFRPFVQADNSTTRTFGGSGLGLSICKQLVALLGGDISLESTVGLGTVFTVTLPARPTDGSSETPAFFDLGGLHCVIVLQDNEIAADLGDYLSHSGAQVSGAGNYEEAARIIMDHTPHRTTVVVSESSQPIPFAALRVPFGACPGGVRHVLLMRGYHRLPYQETVDIVTVDGDAMRRKTFLHAVAIAAERARPIAEAHRDKPFERILLPSVEEAAAQRRLILVAEDNEINQKVIQHQLALLGFVCEIVGNGLDALNYWRTGKYALLLSDLHMPGLDGHDLAKRIREEEGPGQHTPIIAFTANITRGERERCRESGMNDYLAKPAQLDAFKAILDKWLTASKHRGTPPTPAGPPPSPVLDPSALARYVGDDPEVVTEFLRDYLESARSSADEIATAATNHDWDTVRATGHRLKSSSRTVGARALGDFCERLEHADDSTINDLLREFDSHVKIVLGNIRQLLGE